MTYERRLRGERVDTMEAAEPTERQRLDVWRAGELERRGFDPHAVELLVLAQADIHDVDRLLDAGCPLPTALLILL